MKELKVGMYVRFRTLSNEVKIRKIIKIDNNIYELDKNEVTTDKYIIGESSENIIDLLEENDLLSIEYYSPRYEERVTRLFEVDFKYDESIVLTNSHCTFNLTNGEYSELDKKLNPIIKSVVTKEQFNSVKYEVE